MSSTGSSTAVSPALLAHIRQLVECESPSSDAHALERSADAVAALGSDVLGTDPERITVEGVPHLRWSFGSGTRVLVLAHHDTVWPVGSLARLPFDVEDGRMTGPGCFDMKTGLVMALHAIAALTDRDGVTLLVTGDEETGSTSSRDLIEETARGADAALVLEAAAPGGDLKLERKGVSMYEIVITGRAAHAGLEPENGVNATIALAHEVIAVAAIADPVAGTTVTPTVAASGTTINTVPDEASFRIDVRARTAAEQQRVDTALRARRSPVPGAVIEVRAGGSRPPLERTASAALFARAQRIAADLGLPELHGTAVGGGSDGNITAGIGIPTLDGLGAVGGGAHADDEHVLVEHIAPRTLLLTALIADLLATGAPS